MVNRRNSGERLAACATIVGALIAGTCAIIVALPTLVPWFQQTFLSTPPPTITQTRVTVSYTPPTPTLTPTYTLTYTLAASETPTETATPFYTNTFTLTHTTVPSYTPTFTNTHTPTFTDTLTLTHTTTPSDTPTNTATYTYTNTSTPTYTTIPSETPTPSNTHTPISTPTHTSTLIACEAQARLGLGASIRPQPSFSSSILDYVAAESRVKVHAQVIGESSTIGNAVWYYVESHNNAQTIFGYTHSALLELMPSANNICGTLPLSTPDYSPTPIVCEGEVQLGLGASIRAEPAFSSSILDYVAAESRVKVHAQVIGESSTIGNAVWYYVESNNNTQTLLGFMHSSLLEIAPSENSICNILPIVTLTPTPRG
jgi:hypothetical protein